jgi:hypothetical protein
MRSLDEALNQLMNWLDANPGREVTEFREDRTSLLWR